MYDLVILGSTDTIAPKFAAVTVSPNVSVGDTVYISGYPGKTVSSMRGKAMHRDTSWSPQLEQSRGSAHNRTSC